MDKNQFSKALIKIKAYGLTHVVIDVLTVLVLFVVGQLVVSLILGIGGVDSAEALSGKQGYLLAAYILGGISMIGGLLVIMRLRHIPLSVLHIQKPNFTDVGYGLLGYGAYLLILVLVFTFVTNFIPGIDIGQKQDLGLNISSSGPVLVAIYFALAVVPAISEELLFRGFLYNRMRSKKLGALLSAFIVSALFATFHGQVNVAIDTFILSMVMIYVFETRKSLWVTVTMHLIKNSIAFIGLFVIQSTLS